MPKVQRIEFVIPPNHAMFCIKEFEKNWLENFLLFNTENPLTTEQYLPYVLNYHDYQSEPDSHTFIGKLVNSSLYTVQLHSLHYEAYKVGETHVSGIPYEFLNQAGVFKSQYDYHKKNANKDNMGQMLNIGVALFHRQPQQLGMDIHYAMIVYQQVSNPNNIAYTSFPIYKLSRLEAIEIIDSQLWGDVTW